MINVRLAGYRQYRKWLFTRLSLVMSLMVSYFMLSFSLGMSWMKSGTEMSQFLRICSPRKCTHFQTKQLVELKSRSKCLNIVPVQSLL